MPIYSLDDTAPILPEPGRFWVAPDAHVIGINQQISTNSGGNEGVGFAVPIGLVAHSLDELRRNGEVKYAYIGVTTEPVYPQLAERLGLPTDSGAIVAKVISGGPADQAGLVAADQTIHFQGQEVRTGGDVITAVDGQKIENESDLPEIIARHYRLTPSELRVLLAVIEVGGVPEVAEALGIADTTVKTHLGSVYGKTGTSRQADLVKLVAGFRSPLAA